MNDMANSPNGGLSLAAHTTRVLDGMMHWRDEIDKALRQAGYSHTFDDITGMVLSGKLTFFEFKDCFCLAQITSFPQFSTFHFMIAGGKLDGIINQTEYFQKLAKAHGCKYLSFSGRKGFEPHLRKEGWKHKFTTMWLEAE